MMKTDNRKIALVGTGMVGMSFAYSLLNQSVCDELVLIDADKKRAPLRGPFFALNYVRSYIIPIIVRKRRISIMPSTASKSAIPNMMIRYFSFVSATRTMRA